MSVLSWFRRMRVDLFSSSSHWAEVMAEADALEADHDGRAQAAAEEAELSAREPRTRVLFRDVLIVLEGREGPPAVDGEVKPPEPGVRPEA